MTWWLWVLIVLGIIFIVGIVVGLRIIGFIFKLIAKVLGKFSINNKVFYVVLIDDTGLAYRLNSLAGDAPIRFVGSVSQMAHGLRYKNLRPTHIIDLIKHRNVKSFDLWWTKVINPMIQNGTYIKGV